MTNPTLIYAAAPLSAPTVEGRLEHLDLACRFRDLLGAGHGARFVYLPHVQIAVPHGYPHDEETPEIRASALGKCFEVVGAVARAGGELHVLLRGDGAMSGGCRAEVDHYRDEGGRIVCGWAYVDGGFAPREVR